MTSVICSVSPTQKRLRKQGFEVLSSTSRTFSSNISIGIINLMPDMALLATERQYCKQLCMTNVFECIKIRFATLNQISRSECLNKHISTYYEDVYSVIKNSDALIITGAPPLHCNIANETYWSALTNIFDFKESMSVISTIHSCLSAHAHLKHKYGIERQKLASKIFGVYQHFPVYKEKIPEKHCSQPITSPHSRLYDVSRIEFQKCDLPVLLYNNIAGVLLATSKNMITDIYVQGHPEYDDISLLKEMKRDWLSDSKKYTVSIPTSYFTSKGLSLAKSIVDTPFSMSTSTDNNFPENDLANEIKYDWMHSSVRFYCNWLTSAHPESMLF